MTTGRIAKPSPNTSTSGRTISMVHTMVSNHTNDVTPLEDHIWPNANCFCNLENEIIDRDTKKNNTGDSIVLIDC
jgi:hypothetical protein